MHAGSTSTPTATGIPVPVQIPDINPLLVHPKIDSHLPLNGSRLFQRVQTVYVGTRFLSFVSRNIVLEALESTRHELDKVEKSLLKSEIDLNEILRSLEIIRTNLVQVENHFIVLADKVDLLEKRVEPLEREVEHLNQKLESIDKGHKNHTLS
ncbi:unnamed protein product [Didymodactylos carnosus]|uniref:Uncharacterized protein n=2 Tax=Didymodactylos carnosus TaxID=1234261 RepID=A0A8S2EPI2_9BILA|nr:unnamed protein product [Didymodactylos carnosus]CAF4012289.1 unnamed protein product [Didymodactylos carnosus]